MKDGRLLVCEKQRAKPGIGVPEPQATCTVFAPRGGGERHDRHFDIAKRGVVRRPMESLKWRCAVHMSPQGLSEEYGPKDRERSDAAKEEDCRQRPSCRKNGVTIDCRMRTAHKNSSESQALWRGHHDSERALRPFFPTPFDSPPIPWCALRCSGPDTSSGSDSAVTRS